MLTEDQIAELESLCESVGDSDGPNIASHEMQQNILLWSFMRKHRRSLLAAARQAGEMDPEIPDAPPEFKKLPYGRATSTHVWHGPDSAVTAMLCPCTGKFDEFVVYRNGTRVAPLTGVRFIKWESVQAALAAGREVKDAE